MDAVEKYFSDLGATRATGAALVETSFYTPLANLLNEIGKELKPKVRCVMTLKNQGAGHPDGGLFTADQFPKRSDPEPPSGTLPSRGAIEVKSTGDDAWVIADTDQVSKYWTKYRLVLVTNYRDFVLVGEDAEGESAILDSFRLAESEAEFWANVAHPRKFAKEKGALLYEFLKRTMMHSASLADPKDVAELLASYAKDARVSIESSDLPALQTVRAGLEEALGLKFEGEKGDHFFKSTLIQTLFYGTFSAWVLWSDRPKRKKGDKFDWRLTAYYLHVPMIRTLYDLIGTPTKLGALGLDRILDLVAATLNRVVHEEFFRKFQKEHAVQYFYEPFLQAFDPELRKDLGVWYTPQEIVEYMVRRVDTVLREELDIEDGLADERVYVLDPCCGTGAYLVEVLKQIKQTLADQGGDALSSHDLKKAAMERVFGFEILPAPFVISHLQIGLMLQDAGAPFEDKKSERPAVYLTNALTGWKPPKEPKTGLLFPEMEEERDAAEKVKRETPILVVLGNPPYNAFAGVATTDEERLQVQEYKEGLNTPVKDGGWGIKKFNLDDLYVRFFRLAEWRIAEKTCKGVVCYISNFSYLGDPSFVVMRKRFLDGFDKLWFDCMNGDSRETGKLTPEGDPDPSVFSTDQNREGIRVGTAIGLMVRKEARAKKKTVRFRHFWGVNKRMELLASLDQKKFDGQYDQADPNKSNRYSFKPLEVSKGYLSWPRLSDFCALNPLQGMDEDRGFDLIGIDRDSLAKKMAAYFDRKTTWEFIKKDCPGLTRNSAGFVAQDVRNKILTLESFSKKNVVRYHLRPLDVRYCYYSSASNLWKRHRPDLWAQQSPDNSFLFCRPSAVASPEGTPLLFGTTLIARDALRGHAIAFPFLILDSNDIEGKEVQQGTLGFKQKVRANLSSEIRSFLANHGYNDPDKNHKAASLIWFHALAIGYSPAYLHENNDGIRKDWPRIPLPKEKKLLLASAELGRQIAALLDTETGVSGITKGAIRPEMKEMGGITKKDGKTLKPSTDLAISAGWGHGGDGKPTMPGRGKFEERGYTVDEKDAITTGAKALGLTEVEAFDRLGKTTFDIYLNDEVFWRNVPSGVWNYVIGGYQVIKKWLSYREEKLLGRALTPEEARYVTEMVRRIAAILLLEPELDENYKASRNNTFDWNSFI